MIYIIICEKTILFSWIPFSKRPASVGFASPNQLYPKSRIPFLFSKISNAVDSPKSQIDFHSLKSQIDNLLATHIFKSTVFLRVPSSNRLRFLQGRIFRWHLLLVLCCLKLTFRFLKAVCICLKSIFRFLKAVCIFRSTAFFLFLHMLFVFFISIFFGAILL